MLSVLVPANLFTGAHFSPVVLPEFRSLAKDQQRGSVGLATASHAGDISLKMDQINHTPVQGKVTCMEALRHPLLLQLSYIKYTAPV